MRRLAWVGLGALSLACASTPKPAPPPPEEKNPALASHLALNAQEMSRQLTACEALRAKVSIQEEYALGGTVAAHWVKDGGGLMLTGEGAKELELYLNRVGRNLAAQSSRPSLQWTFGALEEPRAFNAVSAPGGYVFVTRGLLKAVENEAQLAGALAHEIAHVTLRHALERYDEVKVRQCRMAVGVQAMMKHLKHQDALPQSDAVAGFSEAMTRAGALDFDKHQGLLLTLTDKLVERMVAEGFAHPDEYAADEVAVRLLLSAGYEPEEYIRFLGKLPTVHDSFAHHPSKETRQNNLRHLLHGARKSAEDFPELPARSEGLRKPPLPPVFSTL